MSECCSDKLDGAQTNTPIAVALMTAICPRGPRSERHFSYRAGIWDVCSLHTKICFKEILHRDPGALIGLLVIRRGRRTILRHQPICEGV